MVALRAPNEKSPFAVVPEDSETCGNPQEEIKHLRSIIRIMLSALGGNYWFRDNLSVAQQKTFDIAIGKIKQQ